MSECPICGRESTSNSDYCVYHEEAMKNIRTAFSDWERALEIDWDTYLDKLLDEENIGKWAREVVEYLIQQGGS